MLKNSIILVGMMGSGKSTIGAKLADELNLPFFDTDEIIVNQEGMTISELFIQKGEPYFRDQEESVIKSLLSKKPSVIAVGGGAFSRLETRTFANEHAITIWLSIDSENLVSRLSSEEEISKRPLLANLTESLERGNKLENLIRQRTFAYRQAHYVLDVAKKTPNEVVNNIVSECLVKPKQNPLRRAVVIGKTIRYSWSPFIHSFWIKEHNLLGTYHPIEVPEEHFPSLIRYLRDTNYAGCNIAMPYKQEAFALVDNTDNFSQSVSAINTVSINSGVLSGQNTDSYGFIQSIVQSPVAGKEYNFKDKTVVVLGAGGGGRGVCAGLLREGVAKIILINRTMSRAQDVKATFGDSIEVMPWECRHQALEGIDMLVNATSLGMVNQEPLELNLSMLPQTSLVIDIVYKPLTTELLKRASARGNPTIDGLDMLLHQAVPGFEAWFGIRPQVTPALREHIINLTSSGFTNRGDFVIPKKFIENESKHGKPYAQDDQLVRYKAWTCHYSKKSKMSNEQFEQERSVAHSVKVPQP